MRTSDIRHELMQIGRELNGEEKLPEFITNRLSISDDESMPICPKEMGTPPNLIQTEAELDPKLIELAASHFYFALEDVEAEIRGQYVWLIGDTLRVAGLRQLDETWTIEISRTDTEKIRNMGVRYTNITTFDFTVDEGSKVF